MRTLERELLLLAVLGAALLLRRPRVWAGWIFGVAALIAIAAQVWTEGARWQVIPLYLALLLGTWQLTRAGAQRGRILWALVLAALAATGLLLAWLLPVFQLPPPTGPYAIGTEIRDLTDPARGADGRPGSLGQRELVVQLWYPALPGRALARYVRPAEVQPLFRYLALVRTHSWLDAPVLPMEDLTPAAPMPVILFGPMWGGRRTLDTALVEELASHGYLVAAIDHPGNAARVLLPGGRLVRGAEAGVISTGPGSSVAGIETAWAAELAVWTADNERVLAALDLADRDPRSPFAGRLDLAHVGALGHSFGGAASLNLLGLDPRVIAAVNLDGWTFGGLAHRTAAQRVMIVYEASDEARPAGGTVDDQLSRDDQDGVERSLARFGGIVGYVQGTQHLDFTDQALISPLPRLTDTGPIAGARMRTITRQLVLTFFDRTLRDWPGRLPHPAEVKLMERAAPAGTAEAAPVTLATR